MRVTGGTLRGRELRAPKGSKTRPTTEKVRQAWFDILGSVDGARVLELFAGTGALGIEALSRGARSTVFVEGWGPALTALGANLTRLNLSDRTVVIGARVESSKKRVLTHGPYDLLLADPPWTDLERSIAALSRLFDDSLLAPSARVFVGHPARHELEGLHPHLEPVDQRAWGDSGASLFRWSPPPGH